MSIEDRQAGNNPHHSRPIILVTGCLLINGFVFLTLSILGVTILVNNILSKGQNLSILGELVCFVPMLVAIPGAIFLFIKAWDFYHFKPSAYWFVMDYSFHSIPGLGFVTWFGKELDRPEVRETFGLMPFTPKDKYYQCQ